MKQLFLMTTLLLSTLNLVVAQNCGCIITQIENNTVAPCEITIGTVITVSSAAEFKSAISQANNNGGNMTILISDGTYEVASTASYPYLTASNVVIRSVSGNRDSVVLTGGGMRDVLPATENGIYVVGNNVTIADLTIKEVGNHAIAVIGDNLYVHNVKIQNTREQMLKGSNVGDGADYGRVQCSLFEYTAGVGPQFYIGGIDVHAGNNWRVNDNIFKNIASPSGSTAEHAVHFWRTGADNIIERNIIINCDRGIGFGLGNDIENGIVGGVISNNMIYNDGNHPFDDVGIGLEFSPGTKVYNNTVYLADYPRAIEYRWASTTNVVITNNLTNQSIASRNDGQASLTTNYTNAQSSWFVNTGSGNLRLNSSNSTVVNQGTYLSQVVDDIDKKTRPQGAAFDIGAFEYEEEFVDDCPPPTMQSLPLFQINQLVYDGAFRLPSGSDENNIAELNYSQGPIAYNPDNHSLFVVGHAHNQAIVEFSIPELVASNQITDLNMSATQLQDYKKVLDFTPDGNPETMDRIGGLYYHNETNPPKLFVNAYNYYDAGGTRTLTTLIVEDALNLAQSSLSGYFEFEGGAGHTCGWMSPIPTEWQTILGGKMITGASSGEPIISRWSVGPSAFSFDPQDLINANNTIPTTPTTKLLDFSLENGLADDLCNSSLNNDLWTQKSRVTYGFVVPNTRTYFTIGHSAGYSSGICYKTAQPNGCGGCIEEGCPGYCTYDPDDKGFYYWLWDVDDLIAVKNGNLAPHDVLPYDYGIFETPFNPETKEIGGGSFDATIGQLYLSLQRADTSQGTYRNPPLILVYNVNQVSAQNASQTGTETNICVGVNYIRVLSTPNNNIFEINGNSTGYTIEISDASLQVYESISGSNSPITINTSNLNLPNGMCFISIRNNSNNQISYKNSFNNQ